MSTYYIDKIAKPLQTYYDEKLLDFDILPKIYYNNDTLLRKNQNQESGGKLPGSVTPPTAKTLTYTGSSQVLINAGSSNTGTIQYKLNDGAYDTSLPSATNAGTYTVYYKVIGDATHEDVAEQSITVTINKASGSVVAPTAKTDLVYNGTAQTLINPGSSTTGTIQYKVDSGSYSTALPRETNPDLYTVYYRVIGDTNHTDVTEQSITVRIIPDRYTVTVTENLAPVTGNGQAAELTSDSVDGAKTIKYTKPNGDVAYWNPETPGSFEVKYSKNIVLMMKAPISSSNSNVGLFYRSTVPAEDLQQGSNGDILTVSRPSSTSVSNLYYLDDKLGARNQIYWSIEYN